ncbi:MAG: hypothetical protein MUF43_14445 [Flavobacterium sp.]|jgi:hypothetical protein|nr:hypothetical protein [Flavobacterium sp.]
MYKLILPKLKGVEKLYDGFQIEFYNFIISLQITENIQLNLDKVIDLQLKKFGELEDLFDEYDFIRLQQECGLFFFYDSNENGIKKFVISEGATTYFYSQPPAYYAIKQGDGRNFLVVFTCAEVQNQRYIIQIQGVWELEQIVS